MASFKKALGIGKSKQPTSTPFDPDSLKRTISRPYPLMPPTQLQEHLALERKARRSEDHNAPTTGDPDSLKRTISRPYPLMPPTQLQEHVALERNARRSEDHNAPSAGGASSPPTTSPPTTSQKPNHKKTSSWSFTHLKRPFRLVFSDNENEPELKLSPTARRQTKLHVSIDRKSMASSFWECVGPRESHASDMAVLGKVQKQPEHVPTLLNPKPWIRFRNEEEARQFIRVLPTLRESYFEDAEEKEIERCGRGCHTCEGKIAHGTQGAHDEATPEVILVVTDETEQEVENSATPINIVPRNEVLSYFSDSALSSTIVDQDR